MVSFHSNRTTQISVYNILFYVTILCDYTSTCKSFYYSPLAKTYSDIYLTTPFLYIRMKAAQTAVKQS